MRAKMYSNEFLHRVGGANDNTITLAKANITSGMRDLIQSPPQTPTQHKIIYVPKKVVELFGTGVNLPHFQRDLCEDEFTIDSYMIFTRYL